MNAHAATSSLPLSQADGPRGYAAAVRQHLADLPAETVEELTGGLAADLEEQASEHEVQDLTTLLGPASEYAAELRSSAGLPVAPRSRSRGGRLERVMAHSGATVAGTWESFNDSLSRKPWWPGLRDLMISLRPAWWVVRGVILAHLILGISADLRSSSITFITTLLCVVASVALGRALTARFRFLAPLMLAGNLVVAYIGFIFLMSVNYGPSDSNYVETSGLRQNGEAVENIFAYDSNGKPLKGVRLYDQSGKRIETSAAEGVYSGAKWFPYRDAKGTAVWNTYPLYSGRLPQNGEWYMDGSGVVKDIEGNVIPIKPQEPTPPMAAAIPVSPPKATGTSSGNPDEAAGVSSFTSATAPVVTGTSRMGAALSAQITKPWSPAASFSYQWLRAGKPIAGATSSTYRVVAADKGKTLSVQVTGRTSGYAPVVKQSKATAAVR